jgi:hypothetical protein
MACEVINTVGSVGWELDKGKPGGCLGTQSSGESKMSRRGSVLQVSAALVGVGINLAVPTTGVIELTARHVLIEPAPVLLTYAQA